MNLPELIPVDEIRLRLERVFPEGTAERGFLIRELAAKVIYTMLYAGAIDGAGVWIGPKQVYRMSDEQAAMADEETRRGYGLGGWKPRAAHRGQPWYADTSREPIRDETLRAFCRSGAVVERANVPTTSGKPRYALAFDFAQLFEPQLTEDTFIELVAKWQKAHLAAHVLARLELVRRRVAAGTGYVEVTLPDRGVRQLAPGPSAVITKAVVEEFAPRFLYSPTVLLLSESRKKIIDIDMTTTKSIGLEITTSQLLPDVVLFDTVERNELLIFVEVVANDGPITEERRAALRALVPFFADDRIAFVTAYHDRAAPAFRKTIASVAWNTLVWFVTEPDHVMILREASGLEGRRVFDLFADAD